MNNSVVIFLFCFLILIGVQPKYNCFDFDDSINNNHCKMNNLKDYCKSEKKSSETKENNCCNLICCKNFIFIEINKPLEQKFCELKLKRNDSFQNLFDLSKNFNSGYFHPPDFCLG